MLIHPDFDPVAVSIGPLAVRWYGLMYLAGFGLFFFLARYRARRDAWRGASYALVDELLFWGVLGVVAGGRLGYVLFYKPGFYLEHPLEVFMVWQGGMSFHGGLLGVVAAMWLVCRRHGIGFLRVADFVAPLVPCGLAAGRLGNFINAELWGRVSDVPWAMVFRGAGPEPRHPSQLYQFGLEGLLLFVMLWIYSARERPPGAVCAAFLAGYGVLRFAVEYFREPDDFLGILALGMSMGQWLSLPMALAGAALYVWAYHSAAKRSK
ncbi:MAG: prolipoprotein diacylglyceryl transferase [Burkholderiales bacterium]|nr:prolipoprotein diacylglyceryl transferase [Burkholderiales bacterium]